MICYILDPYPKTTDIQVSNENIKRYSVEALVKINQYLEFTYKNITHR